MPFFNTKDVGSVVIDIPPADEGSINGTIMDVWQTPLEDVGPAGVDKGQGGKYLACVIVRVGMLQCRHPPWLHLGLEDKLGQAHGGVIAARQGQVHHALRAQQRVGRRKELI